MSAVDGFAGEAESMTPSERAERRREILARNDLVDSRAEDRAALIRSLRGLKPAQQCRALEEPIACARWHCTAQQRRQRGICGTSVPPPLPLRTLLAIRFAAEIVQFSHQGVDMGDKKAHLVREWGQSEEFRELLDELGLGDALRRVRAPGMTVG